MTLHNYFYDQKLINSATLSLALIISLGALAAGLYIANTTLQKSRVLGTEISASATPSATSTP